MTSPAGMTQETLIGDVAIMRTLIAWSASTWNMRAATPGWLFMPAPTSDTFAMTSSIDPDVSSITP